MRNLLLLSSSREGSSGYLEHAQPIIEQFLGNVSPNAFDNALFIPFAGVTIGFDDYYETVKKALSSINVQLSSIHTADDPAIAIKKASAIIIGGGNTFHLLHQLYQFDLIGLIRERVMNGVPYIGWSAGSNIASPSIMTTNDMPIIQPPSFHALQLVSFQINPHYLDQHPPGFNGETREQRLNEFLTVNPDATVLGLPEGSGLQITNEQASLVGDKTVYQFDAKGKSELSNDSEQLKHLLAD
jgi:dipeptidase E